MNDHERLEILRDAYEHQYDHDENAPFVVPVQDPKLRAVAALASAYGWWSEITVEPRTLLEVVNMVQDATAGHDVKVSRYYGRTIAEGGGSEMRIDVLKYREEGTGFCYRDER